MSSGIWVLYEDRRGERKQFGLHELVVSCVADTLGTNRWVLQPQIRCLSLKGNSKLLGKCQEELPLMTRDGSFVVAVYDSDQMHRLLDLHAGSCRPAIRAGLERDCEPAGKLRVVLLEKNLESVIKELRDCGLHISNEEMGEAVRKKRTVTRDRILNRAAHGGHRDVRMALTRAMPSFGYLVRTVADVVS